jgi:hypothetical protein
MVGRTADIDLPAPTAGQVLPQFPFGNCYPYCSLGVVVSLS